MIYDPNYNRQKPPVAQKNKLTRKWGSSDERACESLESSRKYIIRTLSNPRIWHTFNKAQADYFLAVLEFEHNFKLGRIDSLLDFWKVGGKVNPEDYKRKVNGDAYYEKAKNFIDIIYTTQETAEEIEA